MRARVARTAAVAGVLVLAAAAASAQRVSYSGSVQLSSGTWLFGERTSTWYLYNGAAISAGRVYVAAGVPVVIQNSTAISWIDGMPIPTGGPDHTAVREQRGGGGNGSGGDGSGSGGNGGGNGGSGLVLPAAEAAEPVEVAEPGAYQAKLGDPSLRASVDLLAGRGLLRGVAVTGFVKAPLTDLDSGVGTGEWDWGGGVSFTLGAGRTLAFVDIGYEVLGDLPDLELRDPITFGASFGHGFADGRTTAIVSFSGSTEVIDGVEPGRSLGVLLSRRMGRTVSLSAGGSLGLSESDADFSIVLGWRVQLLDR